MSFEISVNNSWSVSSARVHFDVVAMEPYGVKFVTDLQGLYDLRAAIDHALDQHLMRYFTDSERRPNG